MEEILKIVQKAIDEKKAENPVLYEFNTLNPYIDHVVICSASNQRQVYAIADNVDDRMREAGYMPRGMEGDKESPWILVDLGTVIVHVFTSEEREHFKLEKLYADLPRTDFSL